MQLKASFRSLRTVSREETSGRDKAGRAQGRISDGALRQDAPSGAEGSRGDRGGVPSTATSSQLKTGIPRAGSSQGSPRLPLVSSLMPTQARTQLTSLPQEMVRNWEEKPTVGQGKRHRWGAAALMPPPQLFYSVPAVFTHFKYGLAELPPTSTGSASAFPSSTQTSPSHNAGCSPPGVGKVPSWCSVPLLPRHCAARTSSPASCCLCFLPAPSCLR